MRRKLTGLAAAATLGVGAAFGIAACGDDDKTTTETVDQPEEVPAAPTTTPTTVKPETITTQTTTTQTQTNSTNTTGGTGY